jgi:hypothetical protein
MALIGPDISKKPYLPLFFDFQARILPNHGCFSYRNRFNLRLMKTSIAYKIRLRKATFSIGRRKYMVSLLNNSITSTPANDVNAELANQTQRLSSLELELERLNQQLRQNQRYTAALEVDFEHLLSQLQHLQCIKKAC